MAVHPTNHRPTAAEDKDHRRGREGRPIIAEEESEDRAAGTSDEERIAAIADSPTTSLCSATASMAVHATKRRPSTAEEWNHRRRGRNGRPSAAEEESKDRAAGRSNKARVTAVADSYQMLKKIGEGAFGAVSKARHIRSGDIVAIKSSINPDDEAAPAALLREAAMLTACAVNPAVVRLREVARGSDMRNLHLVMDYVGRSLADVIRSRRRHGQQFSEEARRAMAQLLDGVSTMHAHGFIHRDLKPGNVLVGEKDGQLKICDLGLAKSVVTLPTDLEGTPGYMAPELLLSQNDCGEPVDMWALGCVMAEMSAGEPLFTAEDVCDQLISIVHLLGIPDDVSLMPLGVSPPSKLRERVPEEQLSPAGFNVLQGLLEYNPKDRLTAEDALNMPWFADKDDPKDRLAAEDALNMPWLADKDD